MSLSVTQAPPVTRRHGIPTAALAVLAACAFLIYAVLIVIPSSTFYIDEGWAADIGSQLANGKLLYRDVSAPYGPVTFYLYALANRIGGNSFHFFRLCGLAIILLEGGIAFLIAQKMLGHSGLAAVPPFLLFLTLGTYQGDRITASTTAGLFSLLAVYCHLLLLHGRRGWPAFGLGGALGMSLLTKQNVFAFDAAAHALTALAALSFCIGGSRREYARKIGVAALGFSLALLPFVLFAWRFFGVVMGDTVNNVGGYVASVSIPFPWPSHLLDAGWPVRLRSAAFYCPLMLGAAAAAVLAKSWGKLPRAAWLGCAMTGLVVVLQFGQMFPLSDMSHYVRASITLPVLGATLLAYCLNSGLRILGCCVALILALHVWPAVESIPWTVRTYNALPWSELPCNAGVKKDLREEVLLRVLARMREFRDEPVFVAGHHGYLYFLTGRPHLTRQSSPSPYYVHSADEERQIIVDVERAGVRHVIVGPEMFPDTGIDKLPVLSDYLRRCYAETVAEGQYRFLKKTSCR